MAKRNVKKERVRYYGDFEGSIKSVIDSLQHELEQYGDNAYLEQDEEYDYGGCHMCRGYPIWYIVYEREETEAEMQKRLNAARKQRERRKANKAKEAAAKEEAERKELARLAKKYGEG